MVNQETDKIQEIACKIAQYLGWGDLDQKGMDTYRSLNNIQSIFKENEKITDGFIQKNENDTVDLYLFTENYIIKKDNIVKSDENNYVMFPLKNFISSLSVKEEDRSHKLSIEIILKTNYRWTLSSDGIQNRKLKELLKNILIPNITR